MALDDEGYEFCADVATLLNTEGTTLGQISDRLRQDVVMSQNMADLLASFVVDAHKYYSLSSKLQHNHFQQIQGPVDHITM